MFKAATGNIFLSKASALVNPVNCKGVMGKGLALQFKQRFPITYLNYRQACLHGELTPGKLFVYQENNKIIICFPTKDDWRNPSKKSYISDGATTLAEYIIKNTIPSVAIPPLGCGLGGLDYSTDVEPILREKLEKASENCDIFLYRKN